MNPDYGYTAISPNNNWERAGQRCLHGSKRVSGSQNPDTLGLSSGVLLVESDPV